MKTVLINLDRSPDRLKAFAEQARTAGISFERLPAVDGRDITNLPSGLTGGQKGLFLSHRRAWADLVASREEWMAVFEDDVHLSAEASLFLCDDEWLPRDAHVIKIETFLKKTRLGPPRYPAPGGRAIRKLINHHLGTAGYIISREGARRLI